MIREELQTEIYMTGKYTKIKINQNERNRITDI